MKLNKPIKVSVKNLESLIDYIRSTSDTVEPTPQSDYLVLPIAYRVLNLERYRGKGRPRVSDYDHVPYEWFPTTTMKIKQKRSIIT